MISKITSAGTRKQDDGSKYELYENLGVNRDAHWCDSAVESKKSGVMLPHNGEFNGGSNFCF